MVYPSLSRRASSKSEFGVENSAAANKAGYFACAILIFLILWFCQDIIFTPQAPFFRDLSTYFYPIRYSLFESYRSGKLPLWDRHMAMGFPLLADFQSAAFYPPHLLFLILSFFPAIRAIFVFHFLVAGLGAYWLCRNWTYPPYLSIVGGLLFALGGTIVSLANLLNHFQTAVWLPWVILFWEKALCSAVWKHFVAVTLISVMMLLAGSPELFAMAMALVLTDGIRIKVLHSEISCGRIIFTFVSMNLLAFMIVMVQLLPTLELFIQSRRRQMIPYQEALQWSLHPKSLVNLLFFDKQVDPSVANGIRPLFSREIPFLISHYVGVLSIVGLGLWSCCSSKLEKVFCLLLIIASLVLAFGVFSPVYRLLYDYFPVVSALRFPEKFFYITYALLLYMSLRGLSRLDSLADLQGRTSLVVLGSICIAWLSAYAFLRLRSDIVSSLIATSSGISLFSGVIIKATVSVLANLERQVLLSVSLTLLIYLAAKNLIRKSILGYLLVAIVFVDLAWAHRALLFPLNPRFVHESSRVMAKSDPHLNRIFYYPSARNLHPSSFTAKGQPSYEEATAMLFQNHLPNTGSIFGFDYMQEIDALARRPYADFLTFANQLEPAQQIQLLRTFNVGHLVTFQPLPVAGISLVGHYPDYYSWLYKIDDPIPRTYFASKFSVEQSSEATFRRLLNSEFNPFEEVVLDQSISITSKDPLLAEASILQYENQRVVMKASLNREGILVLADSYYPGWNAYVDGRQERIYRANLFFRAVLLAAGTHTVEFRYEPGSFALGMAVSIITLCSITLISIFLYLRKRLQPIAEHV